MKQHPYQYCDSLTQYQRRKTIEVKIGDVGCGGDNPIRLQTMTTVDTMDTQGSIEQSIRCIEAGAEYIRITAPGIKDAQNLENIKKGLRERGYPTPLVADIHFTPKAAEIAARIVEKVRINPGNYVDTKQFKFIEYDEASYAAELEKIRERFVPLIKICKEYGTAMRIGTNHGSLSDRIMSRYGDTPLGMVESALEFIRICEDQGYYHLVVSMKSSNPQVMVQAYRLLVQKLDQEGLKPYPLHLGVTEAGEGEDGRIKSALGIGTLLEDGLGDTVRVSLTEEPELEIPVAAALVNRYHNRRPAPIPPIEATPYNPFEYNRFPSTPTANLGIGFVPRVIADFSQVEVSEMADLKPLGHFYLPELDKWGMNDQGTDYLYSGSRPAPFMLPNGLKQILDHPVWCMQDDKTNHLPLFSAAQWLEKPDLLHANLNFIRLSLPEYGPEVCRSLSDRKDIVLVLYTENSLALAELRRLCIALRTDGISAPIVLESKPFENYTEDQLQLYTSTDLGGLLIDGMGDAVMIRLAKKESKQATLLQAKKLNSLAFGILQAARQRMTKTEYISCPSCGRTLFDLQETTAMIRQRTDHLKGVKIGIMGCIVNGPGEMADADYGYVGSGRGLITLYRGKNVVKRAVPSQNAVDELIELIRQDGNWIERE
jgi:(E)-4-hydroxy-3-methylbut-2-enyl-diphosphate synthase